MTSILIIEKKNSTGFYQRAFNLTRSCDIGKCCAIRGIKDGTRGYWRSLLLLNIFNFQFVVCIPM